MPNVIWLMMNPMVHVDRLGKHNCVQETERLCRMATEYEPPARSKIGLGLCASG
jgi:hypothetical protein